MKKFLNVFTGALLCTAVYTSPLQAMDSFSEDFESQKGPHGNSVFNTDYIYEYEERGKFIHPQCTTNADVLHYKGIYGQGLIAAIIDLNFHPKYTALLKSKGVIHPNSFLEGFIMDPDEDLENVNVNLLQKQIQHLQLLEKLTLTFNQVAESPDTKERFRNERQRAEDEIEKLKKLINKKKNYDWLTQTYMHGSSVMEAIHQIAPRAQLLPFELIGAFRDLDTSPDAIFAKFIRKAIYYGADVINVSLCFTKNFKVGDETINACKESSLRGIPIIFAAGNDSFKVDNVHCNLSIAESWDSNEGAYFRNSIQDLFDKLGGKGIWFAGALKYSKNGEEKVATSSQHPSYNTQKHFIWAVGDKLPVHCKVNSDILGKGTTYAAAVMTGSYLTSYWYNLYMGYNLSSEELLDALYESGRDVHSFGPGLHLNTNAFDTTYKAIDLFLVMKYLDKKFNVPGEPLPKRAICPVAIQPVILPLEIHITEDVNIPTTAEEWKEMRELYDRLRGKKKRISPHYGKTEKRLRALLAEQEKKPD